MDRLESRALVALGMIGLLTASPLAASEPAGWDPATDGIGFCVHALRKCAEAVAPSVVAERVQDALCPPCTETLGIVQAHASVDVDVHDCVWANLVRTCLYTVACAGSAGSTIPLGGLVVTCTFPAGATTTGCAWPSAESIFACSAPEVVDEGVVSVVQGGSCQHIVAKAHAVATAVLVSDTDDAEASATVCY